MTRTVSALSRTLFQCIVNINGKELSLVTTVHVTLSALGKYHKLVIGDSSFNRLNYPMQGKSEWHHSTVSSQRSKHVGHLLFITW